MTNEDIVKSYKGRRPGEGQLVRVYRNLGHEVSEKFSLMDIDTGLVVGYADNLILSHGVDFAVRDAGRARVIDEKRKNVHAFAIGYVNYAATKRYLRNGRDCSNYSYSVEVSYNPYVADHFVRKDLDCRIDQARTVLFSENGKCYLGLNR